MTALRLTPAELEAITRRADERGMTRSAYMIAAALGRLPVDAAVAERLDRLERRIDALEAAARSEN